MRHRHAYLPSLRLCSANGALVSVVDTHRRAIRRHQPLPLFPQVVHGMPLRPLLGPPPSTIPSAAARCCGFVAVWAGARSHSRQLVGACRERRRPARPLSTQHHTRARVDMEGPAPHTLGVLSRHRHQGWFTHPRPSGPPRRKQPQQGPVGKQQHSAGRLLPQAAAAPFFCPTAASRCPKIEPGRFPCPPPSCQRRRRVRSDRRQPHCGCRCVVHRGTVPFVAR